MDSDINNKIQLEMASLNETGEFVYVPCSCLAGDSTKPMTVFLY